MTTLLVLTVGQSDVQLVEGEMRRELAKRNCASLHDEIERRADDWQLVDSPVRKLKPDADSLPEGNFALCTPKLEAVLRYLVDNDITATAALILETRRDAQAASEEPRFVGTILARRLRKRGLADVHQIAFLTGQERLEDRNHPRDAIIRREVVGRIDGAVRSCISRLRPARVIVSATGGMPGVGTLVEEIVRLLAAPGASVDLLEVADGTKANPLTEDHAVSRHRVPEPSASYQARRHALELVGKGSLLAAWGAVQHLIDDDMERRWTCVIEWLAAFAASLPIPDDCDIELLKHKRMAVRCAIRVELALRARDIPRAVYGTVAFFEAAFWDWLREYDFGAEGITRISDTAYQLPASPSADQTQRFRPNTNGTRRINDFDRGIRAWLPVLNRPHLEAFWDALADDVRNLRHDVAHNEPTSDLMNDARNRMAQAGLWSAEGQFLTQALTTNVLMELGSAEPANICENLLTLVRSRLVDEPDYVA